MSLPQKIHGSRPRLKPYLFFLGVALLIWLGIHVYVYIRFMGEGMEFTRVSILSKTITASVLAFATLLYGMHWAGNAYAQGVAAQKAEVAAYAASVDQRRADELRMYSLEIRGAGLAVDEWHHTSLWRKLRKKNDNFSSIFSLRAEDYPDSLESRRTTATSGTRGAFRPSAGNTVAYWPVPTFAVAPPKQPEDLGASIMIQYGRNQATLGVNLFLAQAEDNTLRMDAMIDKVFDFMDQNKTVPEVLLVSEDGDVARNGLRKKGTTGLPEFGHYVPVVFEAITGIVLARSDRVDRYLRPYAVKERENNQDLSTDLGKLWAFYWVKDRASRKNYEELNRAQGKSPSLGPGTMSTAYWQSQLPELNKELSNQGPGNFQPSPWLPVRWAEHQIKEFDNSPLLGYLHPPVKVSMRDEHGKVLKPALQAKALQAGWLKAVEGLPDGLKPVRVFYDSTDNADGEMALTGALHGLNTDGHGLDISHVEEGYDIGRRLGNTGVSSPMVQINLATIASYLEGGVSALVYNGAEGSVSVQMVRPPSEEAKAKNAKLRGADPFSHGMP